MSKTLKSVLIVVALLAGGLVISCGLSACGGGGGGNSNIPKEPEIAPDGSILPPDPGAAGNKTLLGVDSNNNGVRDDIERYLATTYAGQPKTFLAMMDLAAVMQLELKDADSEDLSRQHALVNTKISACIISIVGVDAKSEYRRALSAEQLNTTARSQAHEEYDSHLGGMWQSPPDDGSTCSEAVKTASN